MNKFLISVIIFFSLQNILEAQVVPNFKLTDIEGNEHVLYDYLNDGKTIILDVSATWCPPCWDLHSLLTLEYLHQTYGPDGTDELVVIFCEGDPDTTTEDLLGTGTNTLGDWTKNVTYIIVDEEEVDSGFLDYYAPFGFPTVSGICPDGTINQNLGREFYTGMLQVFDGQCNSFTEVSEVAILDHDMSRKACLNSPIQQSLRIANVGQITSPEFNLVVERDGVILSETLISDTISFDPDFEPTFIDVPPFTLESEGEVTFRIQGLGDNPVNDTLKVNYSESVKSTNIIKVYIQADSNSNLDITNWKIVDENGQDVIETQVLESNTIYEETYELPGNGCYTIVFSEGYWDGIAGEVRFTDSNGVVILDGYTQRHLEEGFEVTEMGVVSTDDLISEDDIVIAPNITQDIVRIDVSEVVKNKAHSLSIFNTQGQLIHSITESTAGIHELNMNNQPNGVYNAVIHIGKKQITKMFVKI